jgi:hypothetical protein
VRSIYTRFSHTLYTFYFSTSYSFHIFRTNLQTSLRFTFSQTLRLTVSSLPTFLLVYLGTVPMLSLSHITVHLTVFPLTTLSTFFPHLYPMSRPFFTTDLIPFIYTRTILAPVCPPRDCLISSLLYTLLSLTSFLPFFCRPSPHSLLSSPCLLCFQLILLPSHFALHVRPSQRHAFFSIVPFLRSSHFYTVTPPH